MVGAGRIDNGGFFGMVAKGVTPLAVQAGAELSLYAAGRVAAGLAPVPYIHPGTYK